MIANGSRRHILAATAAMVITCCSFTPTTIVVAVAQVMPAPVQDMAWVRSGSDLYIAGGYVTLNGVPQYTSSQFLALDLSTSWPVTSAPWRALANGTASRSMYGISLPTNQTILTFKFIERTAYTITAYDVGKNTWSLAQPVTTVPDIFVYGLQPVMDPTSGLVYIAGRTAMNVYNSASQTWSAPSLIMGAMLSARYFGSAVYNTARKTIMYVGGYNYGINPTHFDPQVVVTEYSPTTAKWSVLPTTGAPPSPSADHCSAVSEDGKTIIVFGGRTSVVTPTFTGALHILDVDTGVWTAGPSQPTPRIYAACVLVGDQFVVWGGSADANNTLSSVQPIVFDVTLKQWVDSYKAPAYYLNNPPPKPNQTSGSGSNGSSGSGGNSSSGGASGSSSGSDGSSSVGLGPIIGGIVGGLAVIGAIIGFLFYRRRQNKKLQEVREQVSQQRMFIEAERSSYPVIHNSNGSHRNDGGDSGPSSGGGENSSKIISYPMPPAYSPGNSTTIQHQYGKSPLSPHLQHQNQFVATVSTPILSSSAARTPPANKTNNSPHGPQSTTKSGPQAVKMYQPGTGGGAVSGPQEYYSPKGRAPQTFKNETYMAGHYHEQESGRVRQNHPQEGVSHSGYE
ncbi:Multiple epidermal growth factor-like domains protein 8 [Podila epicladia]|nr:Multiple epidermal growth factor-like domains protein 8 [Podila epicladia]